MSDRRRHFDAEAHAARSVRDKSETDLAAELAADIQRDLAGFDPLRLRGLGPKGIKSLLGALDTVPATDSEPVAEGRRGDGSPARGWRHLRRLEPNSWLEDVTLGTLLGLAIVILGGVLSIHLA